MLLHVDYLNEAGNLGFASTLDKIQANLKLLPSFEKDINQGRKQGKAFALMNIVGRWVVVYLDQPNSSIKQIMYVLDFRYNLKALVVAVFNAPLSQAILNVQSEFDREYREENNTVEVTRAEVYEVTVGPNIFACNMDERVIKKANSLGVLPILRAKKDEESTKVCFADELVKEDETTTTNLYAILNFQGQTRQGNLDEGYVYLKLINLEKNAGSLETFLDKVLNSGASFDRMAVLQRFTKDRLN